MVEAALAIAASSVPAVVVVVPSVVKVLSPAWAFWAT